MNFRLLRLSPIIVGAFVGVVLMALEYGSSTLPAVSFLRRLEGITFDWRVRQSLHFEQPRSAKLGIVFVDDQTLADMKEKLKLEWPLPRWVHGVVLKELTTQHAACVAYDIFFSVKRPDQRAPSSKPGQTVSSDDYFAQEIARNGNVLLGAADEPLSAGKRLILPDPLFSSPAAGVGHACSHLDEDGIMRRVAPVFQDEQRGRIWQLGLLMAAHHLGLDMNRAEMDPWKIRVPDRSGRIHVIPLDGRGNLVIRWAVDLKRPGSIASASLSKMLGAVSFRAKKGSLPTEPWKDKVVLIGSLGGDPSIKDRGATPLGSLTPFCSVHSNIANSVLTGSFVRTSSLPVRMGILIAMVMVVGWASWKLRAVWATAAVAALIAVYLGFTFWSYVQWGWWLPVALPVLGSVCVTHSVMVLFRFFFERHHRRRLRGMFSHLLSPDSLDLLLQQPHVSWAPQEKVMTVIFADVRGFTALTDESAKHGSAGSPVHDRQPAEKEVLQTINLYLSAVVQALKRHGATLDKYMGDSVMAFWGAPLDQPGHAATAIRAAVEAQAAIQRINRGREKQNEEIARMNERNAAAGLPAQPLLHTLTLGIGLNTGTMTVGFMGAETHLSNYTVFGRAVNIASRLQGAAAGGQILITENARDAAVESAPELAASTVSHGQLSLKGIAEPIPAYEVRCDG